MMLSRIKDRCHGKARGLILTECENRSFWLADVSWVCHLKFLNHLIVNYFSKTWHIFENLSTFGALVGDFEHFLAIFASSLLGFYQRNRERSNNKTPTGQMPGINEGKRRRKLAVNKSEFYCRKYHYPVDLLHRLRVRPVCFYRGPGGGGWC